MGRGTTTQASIICSGSATTIYPARLQDKNSTTAPKRIVCYGSNRHRKTFPCRPFTMWYTARMRHPTGSRIFSIIKDPDGSSLSMKKRTVSVNGSGKMRKRPNSFSWQSNVRRQGSPGKAMRGDKGADDVSLVLPVKKGSGKNVA